VLVLPGVSPGGVSSGGFLRAPKRRCCDVLHVLLKLHLADARVMSIMKIARMKTETLAINTNI